MASGCLPPQESEVVCVVKEDVVSPKEVKEANMGQVLAAIASLGKAVTGSEPNSRSQITIQPANRNQIKYYCVGKDNILFS